VPHPVEVDLSVSGVRPKEVRLGVVLQLQSPLVEHQPEAVGDRANDLWLSRRLAARWSAPAAF